MKNIFIALLFLTLSSIISAENFFPREILSSEDSFNLSASVFKDDLIISILINEKSYIYSEQLSLTDGINDISYETIGELLEIKDEFLGESLIYRNSLDLLVKNLDRYINKSLMLTYQGCLEKVICYPKISKNIKIKKDNKSNIFFEFL